jgi:hypothetical protein
MTVYTGPEPADIWVMDDIGDELKQAMFVEINRHVHDAITCFVSDSDISFFYLKGDGSITFAIDSPGLSIERSTSISELVQDQIGSYLGFHSGLIDDPNGVTSLSMLSVELKRLSSVIDELLTRSADQPTPAPCSDS